MVGAEGDIEVEIRSFIPKEKYEELIGFFNKNGKLLSEDYQETHYLDEKGDLRLQKNNFFAKIWMKKGKLHDEAREEMAVQLKKEDFPMLERMFESMGYKTHIKWFRNRHTFAWRGISVMVDFSRGYGHIIELEKMSTAAEKDNALALLKEKLKQLGIEQTPREEFDRQYNNYKNHWEELTKS